MVEVGSMAGLALRVFACLLSCLRRLARSDGFHLDLSKGLGVAMDCRTNYDSTESQP